MQVGAIWMVGGIVLNVILYIAQRNERRMLIAFGVVFWGLMQILRGFDRYRTGRIRAFWNFK